MDKLKLASVIGVRATSMYIVPHNPEWKNIYKAESEKILRKLDVDIEFHHIGSTSIDGLSSKDCIDVLGVIENFELGLELVKPFKSLGFIYKGEYGIPRRHYFSKPLNPKMHIHICPKGHEQIKRHLHFVKVMKSDFDLVQELNKVKGKLSSNYSKEIYQLRKKAYYEKILAIEL